MILTYLANIGRYVPELLAVLTMIGLLFVDSTYDNEDKKKPMVYATAIIGLLSVLIALLFNWGDEPVAIFTGAMIVDPFSILMKIIIVLGTLGAIYLSSQSREIYWYLKSEFSIIAVGVMIGGMILVSANNFLMLYIGIETLSVLSYVLANFKKDDELSSEAGLKYVLYGGMASGVMLFGMSHIFGVLGTIQFSNVSVALASLSNTEIAILLPSFLMFFAGIGYKIAAVPFHMWSPDVYEGSPTPVTAFFSIVPKVAGIAVLMRVSLVFFGETGSTLQVGWVGLLSVVGALTMTLGNVSAINQRSVKRMLAYSSISHAGMMLMGILVLNEVGISAVLFYSIVYLFMTLVAFYIVTFVTDQYQNDHFERFSGLVYKHPLMAISMAIVMFSLAGIPPLSGFVAKFNILIALINDAHYTLAVIAVLNSVAALYYYLKIVRLMILKDSESSEPVSLFGFVNQSVIVAMVIPVLFFGIFWSKIISTTSNSILLVIQ